MTQTSDQRAVLDFWFDEIEPAQWWKADPAFDAIVRERFGDLHRAAAQGELYAWRGDANGRLAEIIVLDQFSRNIHRGTPAAFASDPMALALAQEAVAGGHDQALTQPQRLFLWLHLYDPHDPYEPPEPYAARYGERPYDGEVAWSDELVGRLDGVDGERDHEATVDEPAPANADRPGS